MKYSLLITITLFLGSSCSEDFLEPDVRSLPAADNLFTSIDGFDQGLNGLYARVRLERGGMTRSGQDELNGASNNLTCALMMGGTDLIYANRPWGSERFLNDWGGLINAGSTYPERVWDWLYEIVNAANTIVDRAAIYEPIESEVVELNRIAAEARTIRAWAYRHLTYLFGDVPLNLKESKGNELRFDWERNTVQEVRQQMRADLEFAAEHLPAQFSSDGKIVRATALHYLTELHLAMGNDTDAVTSGEEALAGPQRLVTERYGVNAGLPGTPYTDMFLDGNSNPSEGNTEALWVLQNDLDAIGGDGDNIMRRWFMSEYSSTNDGGQGLLVTVERGGRGQTRLSATTFMLNLYDTDVDGTILDDRGSSFAWRRFFTYIDGDPIPSGAEVGDTVFLPDTEVDPLANRFWPYTRKWDYAFEEDPRTSRAFNDQIYLRLADTYLLLAEAYFNEGNTGRATELINELRTRANAPLIDVSDLSLDFILDERARELFSEEHRRYTLLRTNKWVERTQAYNTVAGPNLDPAINVLYPIPQNFIDSNIENEILNNPGY